MSMSYDSNLPEAVTAAFPSRPLRVLRVSHPPTVVLLIAIAVLAITAWVIWLTAQSLGPDYQIAAHPVPVDGDITGQCEVRQAVLTDCDVSMHYEVNGQSYDVKRSFFWFDTAGGEYKASIVRSATQPGVATLNIAIDRLWNRLIMALLLIVLLGSGGVISLRNWRKLSHLRRQYPPDRSQMLSLVRVTVIINRKRSSFCTYVLKVNGKKYRLFTRFTKQETGPLLTKQGAGVAVVAQDAPQWPVLLDAQATRLDLSEEERAALLQAVTA